MASDFDAVELPVLCPAIHHVSLNTSRLQTLVDWYALVIGARVTFQRHDAFLTNDAGNHRIGIRENPEYEMTPNPSREVGMHHSAFEYRSLDELLLTWVRLDREGISPAYCLDHGMTTSFYYRDPDGNHVELQADNWGNWGESTAFMREDPRFHDDPIGRPIDPAKLLEARRSGLSPWEIHVVAYRGDLAPDVVVARTDR